jgi:hypothetical protein
MDTSGFGPSGQTYVPQDITVLNFIKGYTVHEFGIDKNNVSHFGEYSNGVWDLFEGPLFFDLVRVDSPSSYL